MLNVSTNRRGAWRGLGLWNFYFIAKLLLYWAGSLNFHAFYNLVFLSVLLLPLPPLWLHRTRHVAAIPVGVALLYFDSWLPPFRRLLEQPEVLQFSNAYLLELLNRFIDWEMVGVGVIMFVAFLFLSQWIRVTVLSVTALTLVTLPAEVTLQPLAWIESHTVPSGMNAMAGTGQLAPDPLGSASQTSNDSIAVDEFRDTHTGTVSSASEKTVTEVLQSQLAAFYEYEAPA